MINNNLHPSYLTPFPKLGLVVTFLLSGVYFFLTHLQTTKFDVKKVEETKNICRSISFYVF